MKRFSIHGFVAAVMVGLSAVWTMGDEPRQGGGQRPPVEPRPGGLQREVERPGPGPRLQLSGQIVDLEGVNEPVTVEMSDTVRITGRGIAGAQIAIDVKGVGKLIAANNVRKVKDGLGSQVKEFLVQPTKPGKMTVKVTVNNPAGGGRSQVQEYAINVSKPSRQAEVGLKVVLVFPQTPAAQAGLEKGDVIVRVNGIPVGSQADLTSALTRAGGSSRLEVLDGRTGSLSEVTVNPIMGRIGVQTTPVQLDDYRPLTGK
jgi:membrane-associated protease RseP (regulator of RpoE activity)